MANVSGNYDGDGDGDGVSAIVPTNNSEETLERCLASLHRQSAQCKEILIIDNHSSDSTIDIATALGAKVIRHIGTQASARNRGIEESSGRYILFADSDQVLDGGVVEECLSLCEKQGAEAVKIPEIFEGDGFWGASSALWKNHVILAEGESGGIPRFYDRRIFDECGRFNGDLVLWEDYEFYQRIRAAGAAEAWCGAKIRHIEPKSLRQMIRKSYRYGRSVSRVRGSFAGGTLGQKVRVTFGTLASVLRSGRNPSVFGCMCLLLAKGLATALGMAARS